STYSFSQPCMPRPTATPSPYTTLFRSCYLLGEGYAKTFKELMEGTEWEKYGVGKYEKCANCMVHCGFEGTAATDAIKHPLKMLPDRKSTRLNSSHQIIS